MKRELRMKKFICVLLSVLIALGAGAPVFAAGSVYTTDRPLQFVDPARDYYNANRPLQLEDPAEPYQPPRNVNNNPGTGR
jgi:hypothetical protein